MYVSHDALADAISVHLHLPEGGVRGGERIDEGRYRHYDNAGNVYSYEFLFVSRGVSFEGIAPEDATRIREAVRKAIASLEPLALTAETGCTVCSPHL